MLRPKKEVENIKKVSFFLILLFVFLNIASVQALTLSRDEQIYASGETIGIKLETGVLVSGVYGVLVDKKMVYPARDAGLKEGDRIVSINNNRVSSFDELMSFIEGANHEVSLSYLRNGILKETKITPAKKDDGFSLGLLIKENVLGVGTLTYVIPNVNIYGALGHSINSPFISGRIVKAEVTDIKKGERGFLGEKHADVYDTELGDVKKNTETGIHGYVDNVSDFELKPYKIGTLEECKKGKALLLTSIDGSKIEEFEIEILDVADNPTKCFKIKVTDERLLAKTNGIVQGMSGSPIIQNDLLIGAVTHVIISDPHYGYGIGIEKMLSDMDIDVE